ncbi:MAG TPA: LuxR C-terminal-related transcriptional regulator [Jatrophihabitantaceae bacterium]|nr:LuxR C-terminal-related transcriptional regulator [Jatrophihabitantaceae bacterium]
MASGPGTLLVDTAQPADVATVMRAATDTLRSRVGIGPVFLASADPSTGAFTGTFTFDIPDEAAAAFFEIEMTGRDVVSFRTLAEGPTPVGSLFAATDGEPRRSTRWREVITPLGWGDELRAAIRADGSTWGYLCLHREANDRPFRERDLVRLTSVLPLLVGALRRAALGATTEPGRLGAGVVVVDQHGRIAGATGSADAWLDELGPASHGGLPLLVAGLAKLVLDSGAPATSTLATRAGRLGTVEAALLDGTAEPQVAVVISEAAPERRFEQLAAATTLTARERQVVMCVLDGMSTRAIADELTISQRTVQAHLTSVFTKTGVRSRRALITRLH